MSEPAPWKKRRRRRCLDLGCASGYPVGMMTNTLDNDCAIPILTSAAPLAERYDVWLCDIWGVMHNGVRAFAGAIDACRKFRERGGVVVLISNAPRPCAAVAAQIAGFGVPEACYDGVVTSGDVSRALIQASDAEEARRVFHLGPERDLPIFEGLKARRVPPEEAEIILCSGLYDDEQETPDDYATLLRRLLDLGLRMICANPDVVVGRGEQLVYCAGALAQAYEKLGGDVVYAGKPYAPIYDLALAMAAQKRGGITPARRVLAIGDGVETDLAGAASQGVDALFVAGGMHKARFGGRPEPAAVAEFFAAHGLRPLAVIPELSW